MCKFNPKNGGRRIDKCMIGILRFIECATPCKPVACCCGHGKYPMTVVVRIKNGYGFELFSGVDIPRKKRFYKRDEQGYYYIPELIKGR